MAKQVQQPDQNSNLGQLELIALQARYIYCSIRLDLPDCYALFKVISHGQDEELKVETGYTFYYSPDYAGPFPALKKHYDREVSSTGHYSGSEYSMWWESSIAGSLKSLIADYGHGTPDFDSIKIETKKSPLNGAELAQLWLAVWMEAFGHKVPDAEGLKQKVSEARSKAKDLRQSCFEWLHCGTEGVAKWNNLRLDDREGIGMLGECQFGGCDLRDVDFTNQDLRGSDFRKANLQGASLSGSDCRDVKFCGANLSEACLSGAKFLQADFSDAMCKGAALNDADCRGAIFAGTDLSAADFTFADLRQVDLSQAILDGTKLFRIMYDEQTRFPPGFVIDPELRMEWKGAAKRLAGYKSVCTLEELLALIPAPRNPRNATGDWDAIEAQTGLRFPADFKRLIEAYGSGEMLGDLQIYNPLTTEGQKSIASELDSLEQIREALEFLWAIYPEESGMLPWGSDSNGNVFCWFAAGQPDDWETGQFGHGADEPDRDAVNITTFLVNYSRNQYPEMQGGLTFEKSDYKFLPDN